MSTVIDDLTPQVDGVTDTFDLQAQPMQHTVTLVYNGQTYPPGENIDSFPEDKKVKLTFVPEYNADPNLNSKVSLFYEEYYDGEDIRGSATPPGVP